MSLDFPPPLKQKSATTKLSKYKNNGHLSLGQHLPSRSPVVPAFGPFFQF